MGLLFMSLGMRFDVMILFLDVMYFVSFGMYLGGVFKDFIFCWELGFEIRLFEFLILLFFDCMVLLSYLIFFCLGYFILKYFSYNNIVWGRFYLCVCEGDCF